MKKILSVILISILLACNSGGGEQCCEKMKDDNCDGQCDNCGMQNPGVANPCNVPNLVAENKPVTVKYLSGKEWITKISYDNGNTWRRVK